ncbi:hypothetical protein BJ912DRAFT_839497, partial [Pholiota molesta]
KWGGPMARRELGAIYTVAFLCLLRSDEVLKLERKHIDYVKEGPKGKPIVILSLPYRKTHQFG